MAEPKRDAFVAAAFDQIASRGFEGLRTREVAGAVGANVATLHYYFPTKEDLIRGVVGIAMERFRGTLGGAGPADKQLRSHLQGLRRLWREDPKLFAVMAELARRAMRDPGLRAIVQKTDDQWHAMLRTLLRRARDEGAVAASMDPDGMAAVIVATLKGTFMLSAPTAERADRTIRQLEALIGLAARRGASSRRT